jgi:hypothetical protein
MITGAWFKFFWTDISIQGRLNILEYCGSTTKMMSLIVVSIVFEFESLERRVRRSNVKKRAPPMFLRG